MIEGDLAESLDSISADALVPLQRHWERLSPFTYDEHWRRWLFAFTTVRERWTTSVRLYEALSRLSWPCSDVGLLTDVFVQSRSGRHNLRGKALALLSQRWWERPDYWCSQGFDRIAARDAYVRALRGCGVGNAKVSFAMELANPLAGGVVCVDTHIARLCGKDCSRNSLSYLEYRQVEEMWLAACSVRGLHPTLTRHLVWDTLGRLRGPGHWSDCLDSRTPSGTTA